jgi:hypothetical protein
MRYSVKRTFVVLCVRKYTHIRLQKRFKINNRTVFQEEGAPPQSCKLKRTQGLPISFHVVNHLFQLWLTRQNEIRYPRIAALRS